MCSRRYFNVELEFNIRKVDSIIQETIFTKGKGYVCAVESNNLTVANKNPEFLKVLNHAVVNICDGSVLALILGLIHGQRFKSYIGADLFEKYVGMLYDEYQIRRKAVEMGVPVLTTVESTISFVKTL